METLISQYKTWLIANSKADNTIISYVQHVKDFLLAGNITDVKVINEQMINEYFATLKSKVSQATLNQHISAFKSFLNYNNILLRVPKTKPPMKRNAEVITREDFNEKIIPVVESEFPNITLRIKAMLFFLYFTGLRIKDASKIKREQFDLNNNYVVAKISKQNIEKQFIIPDVLKEMLIRYFASEAEETTAFNMTFFSMKHVFKILRTFIPELRIHPHKFRKSCATNAKKDGMELEEIQEMFGHKSIETTQIYVQKPTFDELKNKFLKLEADKKKRKK